MMHETLYRTWANGHPYRIIQPASGGKAGKGKNKTSSLQVRGCCGIKKTFRYTVNDPVSKAEALEKAKKYIRNKK